MKRVLVMMVAAIFLFAGAVFAQEVKGKKGEEVKAKSGGEVTAKEPKAPAAPKAAKKTATGTVAAISDTALKLQAKESMDFFLARQYSDIKAGDKVKVTYVVKDGKNIAEKVSKVKEPAPKKAAEPGKEVKGKKGEEVKAKSGAEVKSKQ